MPRVGRRGYSISRNGLDWLGVDREGLLYWDCRLLKLTRKVTLATQERVLISGATIVAALATVVQAHAAPAK